MNLKPIYIFSLLCVVFLIYSFTIYLTPAYEDLQKGSNTEAASKGRLVWQKYNCQSCHQLYGLGGYLGPDLTNIFSSPGKDPSYIKAMLKSGTAQMPAFELDKEEWENLLQFLKSTDASGTADPRKFTIQADGMINRQ